MAKSFALVALIVSAFFFSSVLARRAPTNNNEKFFVEGKVYCDPCRFQFESRLSHPLEDSSNVTYVKEVHTDVNGMYSIPVDGDHEEEICEAVVEATAANGECKDAMANRSDRIVLTRNMGVSSLARYVNPLGFMTKAVDSQCPNVIKELGLDQLDN
ncbi:Allergen Ole e 1, conserved site [Sesbania bispinosa]|nr:Allergen Ole e 1, conserved site [Sesbania bispinosa]